MLFYNLHNNYFDHFLFQLFDTINEMAVILQEIEQKEGEKFLPSIEKLLEVNSGELVYTEFIFFTDCL